jgi:putative phosphoesterase
MPAATPPIRIGLISDTHDLVRPSAKLALAGVSRILHAGDICGAEVLHELGTVAPVTAVRGNNDHGMHGSGLRGAEWVEIGGVAIYMLHDLNDLDIDPRAAGVHAVVAGHSHRPLIEERDGVLFVNPGSAGPRRFTLPVSLGFIEIAGGRVKASLHTLPN